MLSNIGPSKKKPEVEEPEPVETSFSELTDAEIEAIEPEEPEPVAKVMGSGTMIIIDDPGEKAMKELPEEVFTTVIEPTALKPFVISQTARRGEEFEPPFLSDGFMADCYEKTLGMITDKHGKNHKNAVTERVMNEYGEKTGSMVFDCLNYGIECGDLIMPRTNYYIKTDPPSVETDSPKKAVEKKKTRKPKKDKELPEFIGGGVQGLFAVESDYFEVNADDMGAELVAAYSKVRETITGKPPRKEVKWVDLDETSESKILIRSVCTILLEKYDIRNRIK